MDLSGDVFQSDHGGKKIFGTDITEQYASISPLEIGPKLASIFPKKNVVYRKSIHNWIDPIAKYDRLITVFPSTNGPHHYFDCMGRDASDSPTIHGTNIECSYRHSNPY